MQNMQNMTAAEKLQYRLSIVRDAQAWKKPDKMPINGNMFNWMFLDAGYSVNEAYRDYEKIDDALVKFVTNYGVDHINQLHTGFRNCFQLCDALGGSTVYTSTSDNMNAVPIHPFEDSDYDELIHNTNHALWKTALPKLFPRVNDMTPQEFAQAAKSLQDYLNARNYSETKLKEQYGIIVDAIPFIWPGTEPLFNNYRGIRGFSMDMRRHKDKIKEWCAQFDESSWTSFKSQMDAQGEGFLPDQPYDACICMLANSVINRKQFEEFYVPVFKRVLDYCQEHGKQVFFYAEGAWKQFGDFFNEYPKGVVSVMVEQDDIYELRKLFPNIALYGGLQTDTMGKTGAKDEAVAMAHRAIDELGSEGGLVLMPNKMVSYATDMNSENLKAVCDFVNSYEL